MTLKEGIDKQHIDRQTRRARHERHHEHGKDTVLGILDIARRHDSGYVTAEAHEHRDETTSVEADAVHDRIHDEGFTGHITGVLHERDEEEEDDDVRQESEHRPYSLQHAVDEQRRPPRRIQQTPEPST